MIYQNESMTVESPFSFVTIHKVSLQAQVNKHIQLELRGILNQEYVPKLMTNPLAENLVTIELSDGQIYFIGVPADVQVTEKNGLFELYLTCKSTSFFLDIYPRSCSFQDTQETYEDILHNVYEKESAQIFASQKTQIPIDQPIFQYEETAWEFTLRMAGEAGTVVVPNYTRTISRVSIGIINQEITEISEPEYSIGHSREQGYFYELYSPTQLNLGTEVNITGRRLLVVKKKSDYENGTFQNFYVLGTEQGFAVKPYRNFLSGLRLRGTVLDTKNEVLKLHLDIDEQQDIEKAYWFDFVPQTGNVMYCMPQHGTKIMLRLCPNLEMTAVAEDCWRENGQIDAELADYNDRYFTTEFEKRLAMLPQVLFFTGEENQVVLSDQTGITLRTARKTKVTADGSITIHSKKQMNVNTPQHIYAAKPNTQSVIDFAGTEINIESQNSGIKTKLNELVPEKPYPTSEEVSPSVNISRRLSKKAMAFLPRYSGGERE